ncbi:minor capsid protein (plasmid) [Vagococcus intermedius]|uniref:Minor capsid protein n=2 Tax=Vagococcus intermedius TaxID=2991418 RepID=A0AAF0CX68_9ENTE|nr:minor capsid protein [Vagococcus intermedius]WEG74407.1 minor capsid protein [Vagococcus intermedius]
MQRYLIEEVNKLYKRYRGKHDMSDSTVKQILNTSVGSEELVKLHAMAQSVEDEGISRQAKAYLEGLSLQHRITRLEDLKAKSFLVSKKIADVQLKRSTDFYIDTIYESYNQASVESIILQTDKSYTVHDDGKYKSYTIKDGKPVIEIVNEDNHKVERTILITEEPHTIEFRELSTKYVKNILESHWQGANYSKRIWNDTDLLAKRLEELFTVEAMTGMSEIDMTKAIAKEFNQSFNVARRLIRTEANYMAGQAKIKGWLEHGVKEYVIVAVLDFRTSEKCQGQDGKRYKVKDAVVGENYPPFHPFVDRSRVLTLENNRYVATGKQ